MGKRNLYPTLSTKKIDKQVNLTMDLISMCDGNTSILNIANELNVPAWDLYDLIDTLKSKNILVENNWKKKK